MYARYADFCSVIACDQKNDAHCLYLNARLSSGLQRSPALSSAMASGFISVQHYRRILAAKEKRRDVPPCNLSFAQCHELDYLFAETFLASIYRAQGNLCLYLEAVIKRMFQFSLRVGMKIQLLVSRACNNKSPASQNIPVPCFR